MNITTLVEMLNNQAMLDAEVVVSVGVDKYTVAGVQIKGAHTVMLKLEEIDEAY